MKNYFQSLVLVCFILGLFATTAIAQISTSALDSRVIHPFGTTFDFLGKFTGVGESGGVPGPTITGCDLYGFRAQTDILTAVNLGIQTEVDAEGNSFSAPVLTFASTGGFFIEQQFPPVGGTGTGLTTGCGKVLALYAEGTGAAPTNNFVYTIFGSGLAVGGNWVASDAKLKRNINKVDGALDKIMQLEGMTYEFRRDEYPELGLNPGLNYGFLTENVKSVMPEAVTPGIGTDAKVADFEVLNYDMVIPVLVEAMKEQQSLISELQAKVATLKAMVNEDHGNALPTIDNESSVIDIDGISLRQNRPNPFEGMTTIEYTIPETMNSAMLVVYDLNGQAISRTTLNPGSGQVQFDAGQLASGIYVYTIEQQNGQPLARQKMIVK